MSNIQLLLSDARGIYIPRDFVQGFDLEKWHIDAENWAAETCNDPDNEHYWDAWDQVLNNAYFIDNGKKYTLYQDGDLFAIAYDDLSDSEYLDFFGEER